jgi:hypothetical protein
MTTTSTHVSDLAQEVQPPAKGAWTSSGARPS